MTGLTKKWFAEVVSVMCIISVVVSGLSAFIIAGSYYSAVENTLSASLDDFTTAIYTFYGSNSEGSFASVAPEFLEEYTDSEKMEAWLIDASGRVILSSGGFDVGSVNMPDYTEALASESGRASWTGRLESGERIMAQTMCINFSADRPVGAVRIMISLRHIDSHILALSLSIFGLFVVLMAFFIFISYRFFTRRVINPVRNVSDTALNIAEGRLDSRVEGFAEDDEIGTLCTTVNSMASTLASTDRLKNDFISTISHELRTPLTAIRGWGETLLQLGDTDPATTRRGMEVIVDETGRLNDMVEDLLDFSRINSGRMQLKLEKIDVLAELDETVFTLRDRATKEGIEINYSVPHIPVPMQGDAARIRQVFLNILDNAIKYNSQGGTIRVSAEIRRPKTLIIYFADSGRGISPDDLPRVKEKFFRVDNSVRGSGIGLAVVDEIVRLHNGEFSIDSILGEGTTVTVTLPVDDIPEEEGVITNEQKEW